MTALTNRSSALAFQQSIWYNMVTAADFQALSQMGINCMRAPFNHRVFDTFEMNPTNATVDFSAPGWAIFDNLVTWGEQYGIYIIPDMHGAPGGQVRK